MSSMKAVPTSHRVPLGTGLGYHVLEWNAAAEHTVLLVHGFLDFAWGWQDIATRLVAEGYHVLAPDMRGHGDSDRVGAGGYYHFMDYVADLSEVVRLCAHPKLSVCGHSMGGGVAAYWAGVYPERPLHLVVLEGVNPPEQTMEPLRTRSWISGWTGVSARRDRSYADLAAAAARLQQNDARLDATAARWLAERGTRARPDGTLEFKHDPLHTTVGPYGFSVEIATRFWSRVSCPTLLVEGDASVFRLAPDEATRRYGAFPKGEQAVLADAGHMMQRHQPAALAALLIDFFRR